MVACRNEQIAEGVIRNGEPGASTLGTASRAGKDGTVMYLMEHAGEGERLEKRDLREAAEHLARAGIRAGDRVLDVGCASGLLSRMIAVRAEPGDVCGVDLSFDRVLMASRRAGEEGVDNVWFQQADVYHLPFGDGAFDVAFSRYTFEYLADPEGALREMKRVVRSGGRVVVADLDGNGLFHYPIPDELAQKLQVLIGRLAKAGFDPMVGRKLYNLFYRVGFRRIEVQAMPHHLIAGPASPDQLENWETKFRTIRPFAVKAFPSAEAYDRFVDACLERFRAEDSLTYSVTFLVAGVC